MAKNSHPLIPHLERFAEDNIDVLGPQLARNYLRRCLAMWRDLYGETVGDSLEAFCRDRLRKARKAEV